MVEGEALKLVETRVVWFGLRCAINTDTKIKHKMGHRRHMNGLYFIKFVNKIDFWEILPSIYRL